MGGRAPEGEQSAALLSDLENCSVLRDQEGHAQVFCPVSLGYSITYFGFHFGKIWISCQEESSLVSAK